MRKFLFIALVLLVGTNIFLFKRLDSVKKERNRLDSNQAALLSDVEHYKTEAGKNAASVLRLELTKNELEKKNKDLTKTVDDLNIKLKRIQAATTTATKTEIEIKTKVRDSIVYRNELDTLLNFRWRDSWIDLRGTIDKGVLSAKIEKCRYITPYHTQDTEKVSFLPIWGEGYKDGCCKFKSTQQNYIY